MEDSNESYEIVETEEIVEVEETKRVEQDKTNTLNTNETGLIKIDNHEAMNMTREEIAKFKPMPLPTINLVDNAYDRSTNLVTEIDPLTGKRIEKNVQISTNVDVMNAQQGSLARPNITAFKPIDLDKFKPGAIDIQNNVATSNNTQVKETIVKNQMPAINLDAFKVGNYKNLADKNIDLENTKGEKVDEVMTKEISKNAELEKIAKLEEQEKLRRLKLEEEERERERQREQEKQRDLKRRRDQELEEEMERQRERERREALEREEQGRRLKELEIEAELARIKQIEEQNRLRKKQDEDRERERLRKLQDLEDEKRRQQREADERERQRREEEARRKRHEEEERKRREAEERRRREEEDRRRREEDERKKREEEERLARERARMRENELKEQKVDDTFNKSQSASHEKFIINNVKNNLFNGDESVHSYSEKSMTNEKRDDMLKNILGIVGAILIVIFIIAMLKAFVFPPLPIPIPVPAAAAAGGAFPAGFYTSMRAIGVGGFGSAGIALNQPPVIVATVAAPALAAGTPMVGKPLGMQTNMVGNNGNPSTFTDTDHSVNSNVGTLVKQNSQLSHTVEHKNNVNIIQGGGHPSAPHSHGPTVINNYNQPVHHSHYINIYTHDDKSATLMAHNVHSADMSNKNTSVVSQSQSQTKAEVPIAVATSNVENAQPLVIDNPPKKEEEKKPVQSPKEEPKIVVNDPREEPKIIVNVPKEEPKPMHINLNINLDQKLAAPQQIKVEKVIEPTQTNVEIPVTINEPEPKFQPEIVEERNPTGEALIFTKKTSLAPDSQQAEKITKSNSINQAINLHNVSDKIEPPAEQSEQKFATLPVVIEEPEVEIQKLEEKKEEETLPINNPPKEVIENTDRNEDEMLKELDEKYAALDKLKKETIKEESQNAIQTKIEEKDINPQSPAIESHIEVPPQGEPEAVTATKGEENVRNTYRFVNYDLSHHVIIPHKVIIPNEAVYNHHIIYQPQESAVEKVNIEAKNSVQLQNEEKIKHSEGLLNSFVRGEDKFNRYKNLQSMFGGVPDGENEDGEAPKYLSEDDLSITHKIDKPSAADMQKVTKRARAHFKIAAQSNEKTTTHAIDAAVQEPLVVETPVAIEGSSTPCDQLEAQRAELRDGLI